MLLQSVQFLLGGITLDSRPRWFILCSTLIAVLALSFLGNYYHRWLLGIGAAVAITALSNLLYGFLQTRRRKPARRPAYDQAVIVRLSPSRRGASTQPEEDLWTLETLLTDVIEGQSLGEYDGNEVGEDGATLFMYASSAEDLFRGVESTLRSSALCKNARVHIRPGPPGTPYREVHL